MITPSELHPTTTRVLREAGWTKNRSVSTRRWRETLIANGYPWFQAAQVVLEHIGGLQIPSVHTQESIFMSDSFTVDPLLAAGEYARIAQREQLLGVQLVALGEWGPESVVVISPDGKIYAEATRTVYLLGEDITQAIELVVRAYRYPDVLYGTAWWLP